MPTGCILGYIQNTFQSDLTLCLFYTLVTTIFLKNIFP